MVWFICGDCGDSIKKPKLNNHFYQCGSYTFTCVDCSTTFDRQSAQKHAQCVTEHEKYALGATKPGGFAAQGFQSPTGGTPKKGDQEPSGLEFLSTRPPWRCNVCNIGCTSQETLMAHAAGVKHKRRARAASGGGSQGANGTANGTSSAAEEAPAPAKKEPKAAAAASPESDSSSDSDSDAEKVSEKKDSKKSKAGHSALKDDAKFGKLVKIVGKKLKAKGKVTEKKLRALAVKKLALSDSAEDLDDSLVAAIRERLAEQGVCSVKKGKLLPKA